jgi:hypothetical protein
MTYSEIFKKLSFEKIIDYNKIIMSTQNNNLISVISSAKQEPGFIILMND